jgi:hypothetical protein
MIFLAVVPVTSELDIDLTALLTKPYRASCLLLSPEQKKSVLHTYCLFLIYNLISRTYGLPIRGSLIIA